MEVRWVCACAESSDSSKKTCCGIPVPWATSPKFPGEENRPRCLQVKATSPFDRQCHHVLSTEEQKGKPPTSPITDSSGEFCPTHSNDSHETNGPFCWHPPLSLSLSFFAVIMSVSASRLHNLQCPSGSLDPCCSFSTSSLALTHAWYSIASKYTYCNTRPAHTSKRLVYIPALKFHI